MQPEHTHFQPLWWSVDLPGVRSAGGYYTYFAFSYHNLPPVDTTRFDGTLSWLVPVDADLDARMDIYQPSDAHAHEMQQRLAPIQQHAADLGLTLPAGFDTLMQSRALQRRLPSSTACYFDLGEALIPLADGYALKFLNDQQDVLAWYLYLKPGETPCVLCAAEESGLGQLDSPRLAAIFYASPTFEEFLYRYWIENLIWFADDEGGDLTPEQHAYCDHYRTSPEVFPE